MPIPAACSVYGLPTAHHGLIITENHSAVGTPTPAISQLQPQLQVALISAMSEHWAGQRDAVVKPVMPAPWSRSTPTGPSIAQLPWLRSCLQGRIRPCPSWTSTTSQRTAYCASVPTSDLLQAVKSRQSMRSAATMAVCTGQLAGGTGGACPSFCPSTAVRTIGLVFDI